MQVITIPKLNNQIESLQNEIRNLRSLVIGIVGKDKEGQYKPGFIKRILKISSQVSDYDFADKKSFLTHIRSHD